MKTKLSYGRRESYKNILSSALISDILDGLGYSNQMLPMNIKPNFLEAKIFGRARTLSLRLLKPEENYTGVYKGLYFLERLKPGEVLLVANGFQEYAFFGELMSTLADYKKVDGVIVDGCTRDYVETVKMSYPVFSRNNFARDIKKRGTIDKTDQPVNIGEVEIKKGNLVFGDYDGIIIIPREIESEVLKKCIVNANLETKIKEDLLNGIPIKNILRKRGEF